MQKAFDQMNIQLHHVISDLTGTTGLAIIDAILGGEREGENLARLCNPRIRAAKDTIIKSLVGDYRPEHLFTLKQSVNLYRHYQNEISDCETELQRFLKRMESQANPAYNESVFENLEVRYRQRTENRLKSQAQALGFTLVPTKAASTGR